MLNRGGASYATVAHSSTFSTQGAASSKLLLARVVVGERYCSWIASIASHNSVGSVSKRNAPKHSSTYFGDVVPVMTPALYQRSRAHAIASSVGVRPHASANLAYAFVASTASGPLYRGWKSGERFWRDRGVASPVMYLPVSVPPDRTPYGKPTTPKWWHASATSPSNERSLSDMSFWIQHGRGTPSLSAAMQNMVTPYAFSFDRPQFLIKPLSSRTLTFLT